MHPCPHIARPLLAASVAGLDLGTAAGLIAARCRLAAALACHQPAGALIRCCRQRGMQHVAMPHQAAHALAAVAIPGPVSCPAPSLDQRRGRQ